MKTKALFAATLIGIGALAAQSMAAEPAAAGQQDAAVSGRADASKTRAHRGGKHCHHGQRYARMGHGEIGRAHV